jgi:hypothetical protein
MSRLVFWLVCLVLCICALYVLRVLSFVTLWLCILACMFVCFFLYPYLL